MTNNTWHKGQEGPDLSRGKLWPLAVSKASHHSPSTEAPFLLDTPSLFNESRTWQPHSLWALQALAHTYQDFLPGKGMCSVPRSLPAPALNWVPVSIPLNRHTSHILEPR